MNIFNRKPKQEHIRVTIKLLHRAGSEVTLKGVSKDLADFILEKIGKNEIYSKGDIAINLRDFSMIQIFPDA